MPESQEGKLKQRRERRTLRFFEVRQTHCGLTKKNSSSFQDRKRKVRQISIRVMGFRYMDRVKQFGQIGAILVVLTGLYYLSVTLVRAGDLPRKASQPLCIVLFYSPTCEGCDEVITRTLPDIKSLYGDSIAIEKINIDSIENYKLLLQYEKDYGSKEDVVLKVFVGSQYLAGPKSIVANLPQVVSEELEKGTETFRPEALSPESTAAVGDTSKTFALPDVIRARFESFSPLAVALAGLVDGVNPCAFTTIIFFISFLAFLGKGKREMLAVGVSFSIAVFATYLMLGFGAFNAIKIFSVSRGLSRGITFATAILAFGLAGFSFYDFLKWRASKSARDISLRLPHSIKRRIQKVIQKKMRTRNLIIGALTVGFIVSLLESVCTGQVYLPTIMFVLREPLLRRHAFLYLVLYNLMFILPLIAIFILAYMGIRSEQLGTFLRKHLGALKLALCGIFAGLGALLLLTL